MTTTSTNTNTSNTKAMNQVTQKHSSVFVAGAIFNAVASLMLFLPSITFPILHITPIPAASFPIHVAAALVGFLGIGYYWASLDLPLHANIVQLGMTAKIGVVLLAVVDVLLGIISWQALLVVAGDVVFAFLFYQALAVLHKAKQQ
jgi:hypothetical protein